MVTNPSVVVDNNFGKGWHWTRRNEEQWVETAENALKGGDLFNQRGGVQVRFEGHGGIMGTSENSSIAVSENEIVINTRTPKSLKDYDGVTIVRVSLDQSRFTNEDTTSQHVFDTRYELDTNITTYLRISPTTSAFAGQSIAFNTVSRKRFDERVVYDVAGSVGLARDRLVVRKCWRESITKTNTLEHLLSNTGTRSRLTQWRARTRVCSLETPRRSYL